MPSCPPKRIQLSRRKGYRKPEGAIVVSRPSKWGNPFRVKSVDCTASPGVCFQVATPDGRVWRDHIGTDQEARRVAVDLYALHIGPMGNYEIDPADLVQLRGHDLACWCPLPAPGEPDICHAAILLDIANGGAA